MSPPGNALFAANNLTCIRSERVVFRGLAFALAAGGALLLRGPNGSGKSSLLRLLAGLSRPETGEILWQGVPIGEDWGAHRARLHFAGHLDAVKPALTVGDMINFWAEMRGGKASVGDALDHFGLTALAPFPCRLLSAGERKRLALTQLIATKAPLWLLDEPTTGLDVAAETQLMRAIATHRASGGIVVAATHAALDLPQAETLSLENFAAKARAA